jgi:hypothetical protein
MDRPLHEIWYELDDRPPIDVSRVPPRASQLLTCADRELGFVEVAATHARNAHREAAARWQPARCAEALAETAETMAYLADVMTRRSQLFARLAMTMQSVRDAET